MGTQPTRTPDAGSQVSPYGPVSALPDAAVRGAGPLTPDGVRLASFWRRLLATIIDTFVVSLVVSSVLPFVVDDFQIRLLGAVDEWYQAALAGQTSVSADITHLMVIMTYALIAATTIYGLLSLSLWSRTLGQRLVGIAVCPTDKGAEKIGWRQAIPRTLLWTLLSQGGSFLVIIQMMSVSLVLWHPKRQTLPDMIARTQVVRR